MPRPSFSEIFMSMAGLVSRRSTCKRLHVGTVITTTDYRKVLSIGYNGNASGLHNGCDAETPGACGCLHSEENAVISCDAPRDLPKLVYCTHLPCKMCAKRLINLGGVQKVYYETPYRLTDSLEIFEKSRIHAIQLQPGISGELNTFGEQLSFEYAGGQ